MRELRIFWATAAFAAIVGVLLAFVPLLAVHGVESALALGLLLPPWVAATAASYAKRHGNVRGIDLMLTAMGMGLLIWAIPVVCLALNSLRVRQCAPGEGLAFMVLGPAVGVALAACVGVWVGATTNMKRSGPWIAALIPVGATLLGLWTFHATPSVHVLGAFAGYFPGAIYDDLVRIPTPYLTYRASTLIAIVSLALLFDAVWDPRGERIDLERRVRSRFGAVLVSMAGLGIVVASYWHGARLGHWVSERHVVERLGKTEAGQHCVVHMPRETPPEAAQRLLEDCDFQVERTRKLVGLNAVEPVTAYLFRNHGEKKALIGVGRTLIAKPWRREVYLQMGAWPHRVLGHEIVHAVLSEAGRAPFSVAATFGGLVPNPGIVEGAAVALAWDVRDDLDPDQWARILMDRDELPPAAALMSVRFTAMPARRAYMSAGSVMRFLIATRGMDAFLKAYGEGKIGGLDTLDAQWRDYLKEVSVTPHERAVAEVALAQPSIFTAVCPHELAKLRADLSGDTAARDDARTIETCQAILEIEENEAQARANLVGALARTGRNDEALAELDALRAAMSAPKPIVAKALEQYADARWSRGDLDEAAKLYHELLSIPRTDGPARQGEVKKLGVMGTAIERALIYQMLVGRSSSPVVVHLARALSEVRDDGLGQYLEARQLVAQNKFALALPLLQAAQELGLPTPRLEHELSRLLGVTLFALGRYAESAEVWKERSGASRASSAESERWLERIEYARTKTLSPKLPGPSWARRAAP